MKLYHYTTEIGATGIVRDKVILPSPPNPLTGDMVSLTTDTTSDGHGLPDGREVSVEVAQALGQRAREIDGRFFCYDHTEWRVCLDLDEQNRHLKKADQVNDPQQLLAMDIAACHPEYVDFPDELLLRAYEDIRAGKHVRKSPTWWYYKGDLLLPAQAVLERRTQSGAYVPASPP